MEAIKAERFKETKAGLDDATIPPRPRREKRSIIADVEAYAAAQQKREAEAAMQSVAPAAAPAASNETPEPKVVFEDENGKTNLDLKYRYYSNLLLYQKNK